MILLEQRHRISVYEGVSIMWPRSPPFPRSGQVLGHSWAARSFEDLVAYLGARMGTRDVAWHRDAKITGWH